MENGLFIILLCLFASSTCFLLQSARPPTSTTQNYEHLLLESLLDEKKLHNELDPRIKKLEDGLAAMNTALVQQYNKTNLSLNNIELAKRNDDLEAKVHSLSLNNTELVKHYSDLEAQVHNLSERLDTLTKRDNDIEVQVRNLTVNHDAQTQQNNHIQALKQNSPMTYNALTQRDDVLQDNFIIYL